MESKIETLRGQLGIGECALITSGSDRYYLTGFHSSAGTVLVTKEFAIFFVDFRYYEKACLVIHDFKVVLSSNLTEQINDVIAREKINRVYVVTENTTVSEFMRYRKAFGDIVSKEPKLDRLLNRLRSVKSQAEINALVKAQSFTDKTFDYILGRIACGRTEQDIALDMEFYMRKLGSEGVAFDFIVVAGKNSSLPHGVPTGKKIENGDFITMDFGAVFDGYRSDMTRTVAVGSVNDKQKEVYYTVLTAQQMALDAIRGGRVCKDIDAIARDYIYSCGYENCFGHGLGHGVGIDIHENPSFNTRCETVLEPGMVMTVEPGIYLANEFGVRIEDMVAVTKGGCINLTKSTKELIVL